MAQFTEDEVLRAFAPENNSNPTSTAYHVRFKFKKALGWTTLSSSDYEILTLAAYQTFPELVGREIEFQDLEGAIIRPHFFPTFLSFSTVGVILNIVIKSSLPNTLQELDFGTQPSTSTPILSTSPVSTFSNSYTHGDSSCSTETLYSPSPVSNSSVNFDDSDDCGISVAHPRKRSKTASIRYNKLTEQELKTYILSHPGGREVVNFYRENKTLNDRNRKKLVNIVVNHMLLYLPQNLLPCTEAKIDYARTTVNLFPKLKDKHSQEGYEAFYDPATKKGWITNRLRSLFREKINPQTELKTCTTPEYIEKEDSDSVNDPEIENNISFLKFAVPAEQTLEIKEKTIATFKVRRNRDNLVDKFPRFLDTKGLVSLEYSLMFPTVKENAFLDTFCNYLDVIKHVYLTTVGKVDQSLVKPTTDGEDWDVNTKSIVILLHLLPPKKQSVSSAVSKLIAFQNVQTPLRKILENKPSTQPFILAVGTSKAAVSSYYVVFDNNIVPSPEQNILYAVDTCFKLHYVFNLNFEKSLNLFFKFLQIEFYKMKLDEPINSRITEIRTKISNFMTT